VIDVTTRMRDADTPRVRDADTPRLANVTLLPGKQRA
jgi:hypothetical protein